ncbi:serine hydrolase [Weissella soli]|uniref:serine hydrolase n=1 Tax=Weissella soli TaxID=155866 RepID=UPI0035A085B9
MNKRIITLIFALGLIFSPSVAHAELFTAHNINSQAAVLVDSRTGQVLTAKNAEQRLPIASTSKLLTIYLVELAIKNGDISANQKVKIDQATATLSNTALLASVPVKVGEILTVRELEEQALVASSNAAAYQLAVVVAGSHSRFVDMMNAQLSKWGIKNAGFSTSSGLMNSDLAAAANPKAASSAENSLSARELALVAKKTITAFPKLLEITKQARIVTPSKNGNVTVKNTNMLLTNGRGYQFEGLKTGSSPTNGETLVGLTTLAGRRVITVVIGNSLSTDGIFDDTITMLNEAKSKVQVATLAAGTRVRSTVVKYAPQTTKYPLVTKGTATLFVQKSGATHLTVATKRQFKLVAPLKQGHLVATESVRVAGNQKLSDSIDQATMPKVKLVTKHAIAEVALPVRWYRNVMEWISAHL